MTMQLTASRGKRKPARKLCETDVHWQRWERSILDPNDRAVLLVTYGHYVRSVANGSHGSWRVAAGRTEGLRLKTMHALARVELGQLVSFFCGLPNRVHVVRIAPRLLDTDNLAYASKGIRDQIAAWLAGDNTPTGKGDDSHRSGVTYTYGQEKRSEYGVRLEFSRSAPG
jgi:hypothetical protein